ncbi:MAG: LicD family protein [Phascolarctobacterium sp.]|nr:LicD family protein [Phascolarctobacterium sp.]
MVDAETLRKAQLRMVDILVEIDKICVKHDINYWLNYGTLIGAVRHNGFIPWDDDCDICMMREDYERFAEIAPKELPDNLIFQSMETDPNYPKQMTKIRMKNTKLIEHNESDKEKYHQGIFVDVFIWDYHTSVLKSISAIDVLKKRKRKQYKKGSLQRLMFDIAILVPYGFYSLVKKFMRLIAPIHRKNKKLPYIGMEMRLADETFVEHNIVFPLRRDVEFEGHNFYVPNNYDYVLRKHYDDYMILPKEEDRHWHARHIEI